MNSKVLITGVTGYIGGSVAAHLKSLGFEITGLARDRERASQVEKELGISVAQGDLGDHTILRQLIAVHDTVINAASSDNPHFVATALESMAGTGKTFIQTSGSSIVADRAFGAFAAVATAEYPEKPLLEKAGRVAIDRQVLGAGALGIRGIVMIPTMIYGRGLGMKKESIQIPMLTRMARRKGFAVYIGTGDNVWSHVHIRDLVELYHLALTKAPGGRFYYAEQGQSSLKTIAELIHQQLGLEGHAQSISLDEGIALFGPEAAKYALSSNSVVNASRARGELGWQPSYQGLQQALLEPRGVI